MLIDIVVNSVLHIRLAKCFRRKVISIDFKFAAHLQESIVDVRIFIVSKYRRVRELDDFLILALDRSHCFARWCWAWLMCERSCRDWRDRCCLSDCFLSILSYHFSLIFDDFFLSKYISSKMIINVDRDVVILHCFLVFWFHAKKSLSQEFSVLVDSEFKVL